MHDLDAITAERLRDQGSLKWTRFPGALGAFVAEMDFGTPPAIVRALHGAVDAMMFGYLPPGLSAAMSDSCAAWQSGRYGWTVPAADIHPVTDVICALEIAIDHYSRPGSPIILPTPAYMPFLTIPGKHQRDVIEVPMVRAEGRFVLDLDGLDRAFRAGGHLLVLCNPCNPMGRVYTAGELLAVSEVVERHGGRVFADEIHAPLVYQGHKHLPYPSISPTAAGHAVTATSASKAWNLPGLKCAQLIVSNPGDAETWEGLGAPVSFGASTLGCVANTAAYTSGGPWLEEILAYLDRNRGALAELVSTHLPGVEYIAPEGTYLVLLDCRALEIAGEPAEFFQERAGVVLVNGALCGNAGRGHVRLNFATPLPILETIVTRMGQALRSRQ